jgi:hypothetical protein
MPSEKIVNFEHAVTPRHVLRLAADSIRALGFAVTSELAAMAETKGIVNFISGKRLSTESQGNPKYAFIREVLERECSQNLPVIQSRQKQPPNRDCCSRVRMLNC